MKKIIDKYIPTALKAVKETLTRSGSQTEVYEEYKGYTASLGPAIISSGLKPAIVFYTDVHRLNKSTTIRLHVLKAISYILQKEEKWQLGEEHTKLIDYILKHPSKEKEIKSKILAASVALKLALRNFEHVKSPAKS